MTGSSVSVAPEIDGQSSATATHTAPCKASRSYPRRVTDTRPARTRRAWWHANLSVLSRDRLLTPAETGCLRVLADEYGSDDMTGLAWPAQATWAAAAGVSVKLIERVVAKAERLGLLAVFRDEPRRNMATGAWYRRRTNRYLCCDRRLASAVVLCRRRGLPMTGNLWNPLSIPPPHQPRAATYPYSGRGLPVRETPEAVAAASGVVSGVPAGSHRHRSRRAPGQPPPPAAPSIHLTPDQQASLFDQPPAWTGRTPESDAVAAQVLAGWRGR